MIGVGVAAATPGSGGTITACYSKSSGALRVIENSGERCKWYESKLVWSTGSGGLRDGSVVGGPGGVVADNTLTRHDLAPNSVESSELADGSVDTGALGANAVTAAKILNGEIGTDELADDAVTSGKIDDGAVGTGDLADDAVTSGKILDGEVGTGDLAGDAVTSGKILDGEVGTGDLAGDAVTSGKILDGEVGTDDLGANAVTAAKILNGEVGTDELAGNAVTSGKILDGEVGTDDLGANAVTAAKILNGEIGTDELAGDAVTSGKIKNGEVGTDDLADGAVTSEKISANAADALVGSPPPLLPGTSDTGTSATVNTGANHTLMIVGQAQLDCGCAGTDIVTVTWQVFEGATPVSQEYHAKMTSTDTAAVATISEVIGDSGAAGPHTYTLKITHQALGGSTSIVTLTNITLSAVDLGR